MKLTIQIPSSTSYADALTAENGGDLDLLAMQADVSVSGDHELVIVEGIGQAANAAGRVSAPCGRRSRVPPVRSTGSRCAMRSSGEICPEYPDVFSAAITRPPGMTIGTASDVTP